MALSQWLSSFLCVCVCVCVCVHRRRGDTAIQKMHFSFVEVFKKLQKVTISFVMSAQMSVHSSACDNSVLNGQILMKYHILVFLKNLLRKFKSD